jgi:hypothetical protein
MVQRWFRFAFTFVIVATVSTSWADPPGGNSRVYLDGTLRPCIPTPSASDGSGASDTETAKPPPETIDAPGGAKMIILDERFNYDTRGHQSGSDITVDCDRQGGAVTK